MKTWSRMALQRKETLLPQLNGYEQQIAQLREQKEKLVAMQNTLTSRVEAFRTQKEMVKSQYSAAQAQVKITETVTWYLERDERDEYGNAKGARQGIVYASPRQPAKWTPCSMKAHSVTTAC